MTQNWWTEGLAPDEGLASVCEHFQVDLSCLVDGELDESAAGRAIAHLEGCPDCREFFEDTRLQVRLHLDMAQPERLLERYSVLTGDDLGLGGEDLDSLNLVSRLTSIFYQLGKAYVLSDLDPDFRTRVFEDAVKVESARARGRGFIDGVVASGRGHTGGVDWRGARHMLNGKLSQIENAVEKGTRLLQEALSIDCDHEEARLYLAFVHAHEGRTLRAANEFRRIFDTAVGEVNRGHAAVQLARLYAEEGEYRRALCFQRWVTMSGLADAEGRFFFVRFNIGVNYAHLGDRRRSLAAFRELLDRHPEKVTEIAGFFDRAHSLRTRIEAQPGFAADLLATCPELFQLPTPQEDPGAEASGSEVE